MKNNLYSASSFAVLILSLSLAGCASTQPNGVDPAQAVRPAAATSKDVLKTLEILAVDLAYQPTAVTVARAGHYAIKLINAGTMPHDITFPDGTKISASASTMAVGEVEVPEDGIGFICSMPGHSQSDMRGEPSTPWAVEHLAWSRRGMATRKGMVLLQSSRKSGRVKFPTEMGLFLKNRKETLPLFLSRTPYRTIL
jgi:hypothetical protein